MNPRRWPCICAALLLCLAPAMCSLAEEEIPYYVTENYECPSAYIYEAWRSWEKELGDFSLWNYQDRSRFSETYGTGPFVGSYDDLPAAGDPTYEDAVAMAKALLAEHSGMTDAQFERYTMGSSFKSGVRINDVIVPVWSFRLHDAPGENAYEATRFEIILYGWDYYYTIGAFYPGHQPDDPPVFLESLQERLYYNPVGGIMYHTDQNCDAVHKKYLPLKGFPKNELMQEPYVTLVPCKCVF